MDEHPRSLSTSERHRLREIEAELERDDPDLAAALSPASPGRGVRFRTGPDTKQRVLAVLLVVGVAALVVGIIVSSPVVGGVGFLSTVLSTSALLADAEFVRRLLSLIGPDRDDKQAGT